MIDWKEEIIFPNKNIDPELSNIILQKIESNIKEQVTNLLQRTYNIYDRSKNNFR